MTEKDAAARLGGAIMFNEEDIFIETLEANLNMMYFFNTKKSWLHYAVKCGRTGVIDYLLSKGFNVNHLEAGDNTTPLDSAVLADDVPHRSEMVRILLAHGADPNLSRTLIFAINPRRGDEATCLELVTLLVDAQASVGRVYDIYGDPNNTFTALEWAEMHGMKSIADYLRSKGATDRPDRPPPAPPPKTKRR